MGTKIGGKEFRRYEYAYENSTKSTSQSNNKIAPGLEHEQEVERRFKEYLRNIQPEQYEMRRLDEIEQEVENTLRSRLSIVERHMFGSSVKGTMVKKKNGNDMDVLFVLDPAVHGAWLKQPQGEKACLETIRQVLSLNPRLKTASIRVDKNAVNVMVDKMSIDVVPSFPGSERDFVIPDTSRSSGWVNTDPRRFKRVLQEIDKRNSGKVIPLIQKVKDWNNRHGGYLRSYHIEAMAYLYFKTAPERSGDDIHPHINEFFTRLPHYLQTGNIRDPITGERLDHYLRDSSRDRAIAAAFGAKEHAILSRGLQEKAKYQTSLDEWNKLLHD